MHHLTLALEGAWQVLLVGLLLGAGLPALFAVGIRALAHGAGQDAPTSRVPRPLGTVAGLACLLVVAISVGLGVTTIVASGFGKRVSYEHVYPVLVDKKH